MDDYGFDLDTALTMEDTSTTAEDVPEAKRSESEMETKLNEFWVRMMPTVVSPTGVCTVCMEALDIHKASDCDGHGAKRALCGHIFHENCIRQWLSLHSSCPLCRFVLSGDATTVVTPSL